MTKWTAEQTEAIYKSGKNIIVSAGAGSGKTAVLTERVLEKVRNGVSLSNLLILTFTNLAAGEMRERIKTKLKKEGYIEEFSRADSADITTFDAYALSLVKKYHYYLGVSQNITVIDSSVIELYKRNTLLAIFEELYEKEDKSFLALISEYFLKDDKELFNYILLLNSKFDLKPNKEQFLNNYIQDFFDEEKISSDIKTYLDKLFELIKDIENNLMLIPDSGLALKLNNTLSNLLSSSSYLDIKNSLPEKPLPQARGVSEESKSLKGKIDNIIKKLKKLTPYEDEEDIKESILKTKPYIETIINILKELSSRTQNYKAKYDAYEYSDIANLAIKLVKENALIRNEIKNNLNEILIDEYQDTNDIQEQFISYISNNNVYMVGDIKQSIYRFRNANPYIFKTKYDAYSKEDGGIKIDLNKNFRSRSEVINNINDIFSRIMNDTYGGADYQKSHAMKFGNTTYENEGKSKQNYNLEIHNYLNDTTFSKEEVEAFIIAHDIKKKVENGHLIFDRNLNANRKCDYSDFAILLANSSSFDIYKKILEYVGVRTSIIKNSNLTEKEVIIIIKNIVQLIILIKENNFGNKFKKLFLSLGRSFLFNIPDKELFKYFVNKSFTSSEIYLKTKEISENIDIMPLISTLDNIIEAFNFDEKLILLGDYTSNILSIDKLKEITASLEELNYSIYDYATFLEEITLNKLEIKYDIPSTDSNSVKIMTIHGSKGLEFGCCYYSELSREFNIKEATSKYTYSDKYGIIFPYKKDFILNNIYHELSSEEYIRENIGERIRLFYVAATRAREKMIFVLPQNKKEETAADSEFQSKYKSFANFIYSLEPDIKKYYQNVDLSSLNLTKDYNMIKEDNYKSKIVMSDEKIITKEITVPTLIKEEESFSKKQIKLITKEEKSKLDYGKHLHEVLELTDFTNYQTANLSSRETEVVDNLISSLDTQNAKIFKEYEFIYEEDNITYHGIIDLLLIYDDKIKIVDYKLKNISDEAYLKQLSGYKKYIANTFNKQTELYLYSIIDNHLEKLEI